MSKQASTNRSAKSRSKWRNGERTPPGVSRETRVDPAHVVLRDEPVPYPDAESSEAERASRREELEQSLQRQANQLADHLRQRRHELDRRESKLNAQLALLENDSRRARLWLAGREAELEETREELHRRREELEERARRLAEEAARPAPEHIERERKLDAREAELDAREARLRQWEEELTASTKEVQSIRAQLEEELRAREESLATEASAFGEKCRAVMDDLADARRRAEEKTRRADHARAALEPVRAELRAMQRDALQDRLAAEELRIAVAETAPPATLSETIAAIRAKLDDRYAEAKSELIRERTALEATRDELAGRLELILAEKHRFEQWVNRRRSELDEETKRLAATERELEKRREVMARKARDWRSERFEYRETIRQLKREMLRRD